VLHVVRFKRFHPYRFTSTGQYIVTGTPTVIDASGNTSFALVDFRHTVNPRYPQPVFVEI